MTEINREIDETKQRILKKQLELFERNLDRLLQIDNSTVSRGEIKKVIKNQDEDLKQIIATKGEDEEWIQKKKDLEKPIS